MRRLLVVVPIGIVAVNTFAAPLPPAARNEIDGLLTKLETSGCEFNRNGTWYSSTEAKAHLLRKLKYLEDRGAVQGAEQFIELAASASSSTGQPYLVRCDHGVPVQSGAWLRSQLRVVRVAGAAGRAP